MLRCKLQLALYLTFLYVSAVNTKELPAGITTCHRSDPIVGNCLAHAIQKSLQFFIQGVSSFDMPSLDPMNIDYVAVEQAGGTSAFNLKSSFRNAQILGLAPSRIVRTVVRFKKFAMKTDSYTERLDFVGSYTMNGQILVLPIRGEGFANVSMHEMITRHEISGDYFTGSDGIKYVNITNYKIKFNPKRVTFRFDNLFNGDKLLGGTMNRFMNDNWEPVFNGIIPGYEENFGKRFKDVANKLFHQVPFDAIFPE